MVKARRSSRYHLSSRLSRWSCRYQPSPRLGSAPRAASLGQPRPERLQLTPGSTGVSIGGGVPADRCGPGLGSRAPEASRSVVTQPAVQAEPAGGDCNGHQQSPPGAGESTPEGAKPQSGLQQGRPSMSLPIRCREPSGLLPTRRRITRTGSPSGRSGSRRRQVRASSSSALRQRASCGQGYRREVTEPAHRFDVNLRSLALGKAWSRKPRATLGDPRANIGLAVPGRPIGPWSRRTGAPQASATGRDRNSRCSRDCSRDVPQLPGMRGYRMRRRCGARPACRPGRGQERTGQHTAWAI
jgi:hypothetical protein